MTTRRHDEGEQEYRARTGHTPGPWGYENDRDRYPLITLHHEMTRPCIPVFGRDDLAYVVPANEANARLIAEAPAMLELLRELHNATALGERISNEVMTAARALLARIDNQDSHPRAAR